MKKNKHLVHWVLFFIMVFSLPIGIAGCQTATTPPEQAPASTPVPSPSPTTTPPPAPAPEPEPADNPLAKITELTGDVLMKKTDTDVWVDAEVGISLKPGDAIKTTDESTALILFFEGSTIELAPNTEIRISKLSISDETKSTTIELWQEIGKTKSRVEKLVDPDSLYQINTPHAAAIVKGSEGDVIVYPSSTTVFNIFGTWFVILADGTLVSIPPGYTLTILADGSYRFTRWGTSFSTHPGGSGSNGGEQGGGDFHGGD